MICHFDLNGPAILQIDTTSDIKNGDIVVAVLKDESEFVPKLVISK
jgi:SOS-response transcriptional repressor LexA